MTIIEIGGVCAFVRPRLSLKLGNNDIKQAEVKYRKDLDKIPFPNGWGQLHRRYIRQLGNWIMNALLKEKKTFHNRSSLNGQKFRNAYLSVERQAIKCRREIKATKNSHSVCSFLIDMIWVCLIQQLRSTNSKMLVSKLGKFAIVSKVQQFWLADG